MVRGRGGVRWEKLVEVKDGAGRTEYVAAKIIRVPPFFLYGGTGSKLLALVKTMVTDVLNYSMVIDEADWGDFYDSVRALGWEDAEEMEGVSFFAHVAAETCRLRKFTFCLASPKWRDYYAFAFTEERPPGVVVFQITENDRKRIQLLLKSEQSEMAEKEIDAVVVEELLMMKAAEALLLEARGADSESAAEALREHGVDTFVFCPAAVDEGYADIFYVPKPHGTYVLARFIDYENAEVHAAWRRIDPLLFTEDDEGLQELLRRFLEP